MRRILQLGTRPRSTSRPSRGARAPRRARSTILEPRRAAASGTPAARTPPSGTLRWPPPISPNTRGAAPCGPGPAPPRWRRATGGAQILRNALPQTARGAAARRARRSSPCRPRSCRRIRVRRRRWSRPRPWSRRAASCAATFDRSGGCPLLVLPLLPLWLPSGCETVW